MSPQLFVAKPSGILDTENTNQLYLEIKNHLDNDDIQHILINFEEVNFLNSSGLGILARILKEVRKNDKNLYLCSLIPQVTMIFQLTKMERAFKIFKDEQEFRDQVINSD